MLSTAHDVSSELKDRLRTRRSVPALQLTTPGPDRHQIEDMLRIASRIPDHGKLTPWRFIVLSRAACARLGETFAEIAEARRGPLPDKEAEIERERLTRAPCVIAVVSRAGLHPKIPEWEQILSAGAVCYNLFLAANAFGFGANWLTEWYAYDADTKRALGVVEDERIAGFLHIGTPNMVPADRPRPELDDIVTWVA